MVELKTRVTSTGEIERYYLCRCLGAVQSGGLCSHILLRRHLEPEDTFDLNAFVAAITEGRRAGRPRKPSSALEKDREPAAEGPHPSSYVGFDFAKLFKNPTGSGQKAFVGKVVNFRRPLGTVTASHCLFQIAYDGGQHGSAEEDSTEEVQLAELQQGIALYKRLKRHPTAESEAY